MRCAALMAGTRVTAFYGDGEMFHWDYYNSFVIQPMYVDLLELFGDSAEEYRILKEKVTARASRYASVLERMIAPDGSYPRDRPFDLLSVRRISDAGPGCPAAPSGERLTPAGIRCALTAVLRRCLENGDMFE